MNQFNPNSSGMMRMLAYLTVLASMWVLAPSPVYAAQQSGDYKVAKRYSVGGQLTGVISPKPEPGAKFPATRKTYNTYGQLTKIETGYLSTWQNENVAPSAWPGFSVSRTQHISFNSRGQKLSELTVSGSNGGGSERSLKQFQYTRGDLVECEAVRMNPGAFDQLISAATGIGNACSLGPQGSNGPDRITKFVYHHYWPLVKEEHRAVGTADEIIYARYTYSPFKEVQSVTDANNNRAQGQLDGYGRMEYWYYPSKTGGSGGDGQADYVGSGIPSSTDYDKFTYDNNGNKISVRKRDGNVINYTFDGLNNMIVKDIPGGTAKDVYSGYDNRGMQLYARYASHAGLGVTRSYDGFARLVSEQNDTDGVSTSVANQFDANGNRIRITHDDQVYFTYEYDVLDRPTNIKDQSGAVLTTNSYDDYGRPQSLSRANGASTTLGYDGISRINSMSENFNGSAFDVTHSFSYNSASQLVNQGISNSRYAYEGSGGDVGEYEVNGLNQYESVVGVSFSYDGKGNLNSDGYTNYTYDIENRLIAASGANNASLTYDPVGRLRSVSAYGNTTTFVYDGVFVVGEKESSGAWSKRYVHGLGMEAPLVEYDGASTAASNRRFLHTNHLGSVIANSGADGGLSHLSTYSQYGVPGGVVAGRFGYTGQMYLPELQLYHYKARLYSPYIGRFLQTDPIGFKDDVNLYSYVGNDPMNSNDPTGKFLNFVAKVAVDMALTVAVQAATGAPINIGAAAKEAAVGVLNPAKTAAKAKKLAEALADAKRARNARAASRSCCFVAGTLVETETGLRPIEDINIGDRVLARDVDSGVTELKAVTDLIRRHQRLIWEVTISGVKGEEETFETTDDHPWWVIGSNGIGTWITTDGLSAGMVVTTLDNKEVVISSVLPTTRVEPTYNLTVADFHTYFVGLESVLVHNCKWRSISEPKNFEKNFEKAFGKGKLDGIKEQLAKGEGGSNIHDLKGDLKGYKAIDVKGTGGGRGGGRVVFKELEDGTVEIKGIVKGHDYRNIIDN